MRNYELGRINDEDLSFILPKKPRKLIPIELVFLQIHANQI